MTIIIIIKEVIPIQKVTQNTIISRMIEYHITFNPQYIH